MQRPDGPVRHGYKRRHTRPVLTLFGEVRVTRISHGAPGAPAIHPLDRQLRLPGRTWSYECQRRLMRAVVCSPFDEAIAFVAEMTGVAVPKRAAEQLVREAAVNFDEFYAQRGAAAEASARRDPRGRDRLQGHPDGQARANPAGRAQRQGTESQQEAHGDRRRRPQPSASRAHPARGPRQPLSTDERPERHHAPGPATSACGQASPPTRTRSSTTSSAEMRRRDPRRRRTWVIVTDGERALQHRVADSFQDVTLILDHLHVRRNSGKPPTRSTVKAAPTPKRSSTNAPSGSSKATSTTSSRA